MSELYSNNWFALMLLFTGTLLTIISVTGYIYNPGLFASFSLIVFGFIFSIASYMIYNIERLAKELKKSEK